MNNQLDDGDAEGIRAEAHAWIVRMHGADAAASAEAFQAWLTRDARHAPIYDDLQAHWDRGKFLTHTKTGRERNLDSVAIWYRRPVPRYAAVAAIALVLLAAGLTLRRTAPGSDLSPAIAYATKTGEIRSIALADGSRVTLDAETRLQVSMTSAAREVRLVEGSARFAVKPDPSRAFAVLTPGGTVTASDGLFDVTRTAGLFRITSFRGTLRFRAAAPPGLGSAATVAINPGRRLSVGGPRPLSLTNAPPAVAQDWTAGMLRFDGERLIDAVAEMNRHNAGKIVLSDPALGDLRITGAFHANDAAGFARVVATMLGLIRRDRPDGAIELSFRIK